MSKKPLRFALTILGGLLFLAMTGGAHAQLAGKTYYSQTNLRIDRGNIHAVNYQVGTLLPRGTQVEVESNNRELVSCKVSSTGAKFRFVNHKSSGKDVLGAFLGFFGEKAPEAFSGTEKTQLKGGQLLEGMSKNLVLATLGPPPPHKTPSLEMDTWTYWKNRFKKFQVTFVNGKVVIPVEAPAVKPPTPGAEIMYASCNVRHDDREISWVNYRRGLMLPVNSRIEVIKKGRNKVKFKSLDTGLTMVFHNDERKSGLPTWTAFTRLFSSQDQSSIFNAMPGKARKAIKAGEVKSGISREAVQMSWCPAPPHETPAFESTAWTYWTNRVNRVKVVFDDDGLVKSIQQ